MNQPRFSCAFLNAKYMNNVASMARTAALMHCTKFYFSADPVEDNALEKGMPMSRKTVITNSNKDQQKMVNYSRGYSHDVDHEFLPTNEACIDMIKEFDGMVIMMEAGDFPSVFKIIDSVVEIKDNTLFVFGGERAGVPGIPLEIVDAVTELDHVIMTTIPVKNCIHGLGNTSGNVCAMMGVVVGAWAGALSRLL
jgi:hypothetical protein